MKLVQTNYTPGKIKNLLEGEEPQPQFYNKAFGKYHCTVEAGFNTESQKQMQFAQLLQLKELGVQIPDSALVDAATLQNKDRLTETIQQQQQQAQQAQQAQMQTQMQLQNAQIELAQSRAMADQGLGAERYSRIQENQKMAHRQEAEAHKEDQLALLNFAKAMKEIEHLDLDHLQKIISMQQLLKGMEHAERDQQRIDNEPRKPNQNSSVPVR